ncbi:MAG: NUDIX domain-containing protein [Kiritimatiellae bacterium]|nr:NUDIX domain-containing protein [Kiritimatiellia bacterium]MCO5068076.1 NUDIX domain-containing protein [Kiritimatiellia bacterium]
MEIFDIVNRDGRVVGQASREECHRNPALIHQAVHVVVFNRQGELFLQKRSERKDIQPGKWDTSVGGHLQQGELPEVGARRELEEELGIRVPQLEMEYRYLWESKIETELITTFFLLHEGPFHLQAEEISDGRFWSFAEIERALPTGFATPQFESEFPRIKNTWKTRHIRI